MTIDTWFIAGIMGLSLPPRLARDFEHRLTDAELENMARMFLRDIASRIIRFVTNESGCSGHTSTSSGPDMSKATVYRHMGARPCFRSGFRRSLCAVMIAVWGEGIFLTVSGP
ncbi:hypothetical protein ACH475_35365, partial [Streptomyces globisporus]